MAQSLPFTFRMGALPTGFAGTPQQLADAMAARLELLSAQSYALVSYGSTEPTSDTGPWFDTNAGLWKYFSYVTGSYTATNTTQAQKGFTIGFTAPDPAVYQLWVKTDATGLPLDIRKYQAGQWVNIYGSVDWSTITNAPNFTPIGSIMDWPTNVAPTGYLICNGGPILRAQYSALFAVIGTTFGSGDGTNTFNLPDYRGRVSVGAGQGDAPDATAWAISEKRGSETHTLDVGQIPPHSHTGAASITTPALDGPANFPACQTTTATGSTGGGLPHNNIQPSLVVNKIIRFA